MLLSRSCWFSHDAAVPERLGPASVANQISILSVPENLMWIIRDLVTIIMSYRMWQLDSQVLGIYMVSLNKKPPGSREVSPAGQSYHCRIACICRLQSVPIPGLSVSLLCYVASATPATFTSDEKISWNAPTLKPTGC